jgi:uncharacterized cupin superfamily protein
MPKLAWNTSPKDTEGIPGRFGPVDTVFLSEAGGLTRFGAYVQILPPGSRTSIKHWHSAEDEMVYVLRGVATVIEGDTEYTASTGEGAAFAAGAAAGHTVENRTQEDVHLLVIGSRAPEDRVTYPDLGRVCIRIRAEPDDRWTDLAGNPVAGPWRQDG